MIPTARSPAIDTVADSIFYVATDGGAYISDYISTYSYGTLRSRLIPTSLGESTLLETSATTSASVLDFPTDFSINIVTFIQIARKEQ